MRSLVIGSLLALAVIVVWPWANWLRGIPSSSEGKIRENLEQTTMVDSQDETNPKTKKQETTQQQPEGEKMVAVQVFDAGGKLVGPIEMPKVVKTDAEWKKLLTPEQFAIARNAGTERAFCGTLLDNKKKGVYSCICCGLPLFSSEAKFNSGTGWPSFFQPIAPQNVSEKEDRSHGMVRVEINCARCDGHLGHVFPDGPPPTGQRHCLNSESLKFTDEEKLAELADPAADKKSDKSDK